MNRFRSVNEFIPHAIWLCTDQKMNRGNCHCKYCTKQPQRIISDTMGLSARRSASIASGLPPSVSRPPGGRRGVQQHRERRPERPTTKPFAAVRRAPKPPKLLVGPEQYVSPERDLDIRTSIVYAPGQNPRRYRKGELLWCYLDPPIRGRRPEEDIAFWPGIVEDVHVKAHHIPVTLPDGDGDVSMAHLYAEAQDENPDSGGSSSATPSGLPSGTPIEAKGHVPWVVEQWYIYKMKLLGTAYGIFLRDEEVLPYLAYAPSDLVLAHVQEELDAYMQNVPIDDMDRDLERHMFAFDPMGSVGDEAAVHAKYRAAVAPYTLAIQIASNVAQYWLPTDEWECKFTLPPPSPPSPSASTSQHPPTASAPASAQNGQSLLAALQQSLNNNAISPSQIPAEPESISSHARSTRAATNAQTVVQTRFQGLWWGTERIWTDELVRLKIARSQFAPKGTDVIYPPAGPSASTLEYHKRNHPDVDVDVQALGAGVKGLFLRLEGLVVVDLPNGDGSSTKECRASGMLYELVDEDWEEGVPAADAKGKGKAREEPGCKSGVRCVPCSVLTDTIIAPISIAQGPGGPSLIPQPSLMKPPPLPNSDPTVPASEITAVTLSQTSTATAATGTSETRTLNAQLSHPVLTTSYPLPPATKGYKFRQILPSEHEVVVSLSLISGRYYPGLLQHPLLRQSLEQGIMDGSSVLQHRYLWALDGLSPGVHQSMDPRFWKGSRVNMFQDADHDARERFKERWEETKMARLHPQVVSNDDDASMEVD